MISIIPSFYSHPQVKFEGEGVDDYGGPYREVFTQVAAELTSITTSATSTRNQYNWDSPSAQYWCVLPILEPTPSSAAGGGRCVGLEFSVPANVCPQHCLNMYKFLGQVMGIALRCRVAAPWRLSQVFWKGLVGEALQEADLAHIDSETHAFVQSVQGHILDLRRTQQIDVPQEGDVASATKGTAPTQMTDEFTWTAPARGKTVELRPAGGELVVKTEDLPEYVHNVVQARIHEGDMTLFAVRDGLTSVVPAAVLPLFTWEEVELQACGRPGVDVDLLQANTEYDDDISELDPHIQSFWRVLRAFDDRDRSQFLRFVWARSRLPTKAADFHQKFKIHTPTGEGVREDPDQYLPKAHTCFFSINLPRYSTDEIMAKKLSYTMYNCIEMDADFRLADNEASGWVSDNANTGRDQSGDSRSNIA